jgi:hypothetical protein
MATAPQPDIYVQALTKAKQELAGLNLQFDTLRRRKEQLEAFIANTEPLLPDPVKAAGEQPLRSKPLFDTPKQAPVPIWKSIVVSINGKADSFSVNDAIAALLRIGRPVESPNRVQIVRNVLMKKTENFEQTAPGRFRVKKSIKEKEAIPEEKAS